MEYVAMLRARRVLIWYTALLALVPLLTLVGLAFGHVGVHGVPPAPHTVPVSLIILLAAFGGLVVTSFLAPGLIAEAPTVAICWTRPMSRASIAWRFIAVDMVAIVAAIAIAFAIAILEMALSGVFYLLQIDREIPIAIALSVINAFMWYAIVVAASARLPGRGGLIAGSSWVVFFTVGLLAAVPLPAIWHGIFAVLAYVDPLAYFDNLGDAHEQRIIVGSAAVHALLAGAIGTAFAFAGIRLWATREA